MASCQMCSLRTSVQCSGNDLNPTALNAGRIGSFTPHDFPDQINSRKSLGNKSRIRGVQRGGGWDSSSFSGGGGLSDFGWYVKISIGLNSSLCMIISGWLYKIPHRRFDPVRFHDKTANLVCGEGRKK
eukprot:scaffold29748_cov87-Skeletonema_marinoi.AAC.1